MSFYTEVGKACEKALGHWEWKENEDDDSISIDVLGKLMGVAMENNNELPKNFEIRIHYVSTDLLKKFIEEMFEFNVKQVECVDDKEKFNSVYLITLK